MTARMRITQSQQRHAHIYVRVSTAGQSTDGQEARLTHEREQFLTFGTHAEGETFIDVCSAFGARAALRPEWTRLMEMVDHNTIRSGDIIFVERSDRLGRAYSVIDELDRITARGIVIRIVALDSTYQRSRSIVLTQLETAIQESIALQTRTNDNIRYQRANGGHIGPIPMGYIADIVMGVRNKVPNMPLIKELNAAATTARELRRSPYAQAAAMLAGMHISADYSAENMPIIAAEIVGYVATHRPDISAAIIRRILDIPYGQCGACADSDINVRSCAGCFCKQHWRCVAPHEQEPRGNWYCHRCVLEDNTPLLACNICDDGRSVSGNEIMICDRCTIGFHEHCIGIPNNPHEDAWVCPLCAGRPPVAQL